MYKYLLPILITLAGCDVQSKTTMCKNVMLLDDPQKAALRLAFTRGSPQDLGHTLAAIAWNESNAGRWRLNYHSNDFGLFHINIETAANTLGVDNYYKKIELAEELIYNDDLGAELALSVLNHFEHRGYRQMLKSYNEGNRWLRDSQSAVKANKYADSVIAKMKELRSCERHWLK